MRLNKGILSILVVLSLAACNSSTEATDTTATDTTTAPVVTDNKLEGVYNATLPCADCPGIKSTLVLYENGSYTMVNEYQERDVKNMLNGKHWVASNGVLTLDSASGSQATKLRIENNSLRQLDMEGNVIVGPTADNYIYKKQ